MPGKTMLPVPKETREALKYYVQALGITTVAGRIGTDRADLRAIVDGTKNETWTGLLARFEAFIVEESAAEAGTRFDYLVASARDLMKTRDFSALAPGLYENAIQRAIRRDEAAAGELLPEVIYTCTRAASREVFDAIVERTILPTVADFQHPMAHQIRRQARAQVLCALNEGTTNQFRQVLELFRTDVKRMLDEDDLPSRVRPMLLRNWAHCAARNNSAANALGIARDAADEDDSPHNKLCLASTLVEIHVTTNDDPVEGARAAWTDPRVQSQYFRVVQYIGPDGEFCPPHGVSFPHAYGALFWGVLARRLCGENYSPDEYQRDLLLLRSALPEMNAKMGHDPKPEELKLLPTDLRDMVGVLRKPRKQDRLAEALKELLSLLPP